MHFSGEVSKNLQLKINTEPRSKNDDSSSTTAFCESFSCQKPFQIDNNCMGYKQLNVPLIGIRNSEKSLRYFFPNSDENHINSRLKDNGNLTNLVENTLNPDSKHSVDLILEQVKKLSTVQKLLLYLKLPSGKEVPNPLKLPTNPLGSRPEISQTISWIKTHLVPEKETSLPKQDVYNEYQEYCSINQIKPLSTADFGKVMKQVYPNIRPRRLGTRGNSRYCYAGMANRPQLPVPILAQINGKDTKEESHVCKWASSILGITIQSVAHLEKHIIENKLTSDSACANDKTFIQSCKISRQNDLRKSLEGDKRKVEDDSNSTAQTPPERCKGKRVKKGGTVSVTKKSPLEESSNSSETKKPSVASSPSVSTTKLKLSDLPPIPPLKRLKSNQSKSTGRESEFLENDLKKEGKV